MRAATALAVAGLCAACGAVGWIAGRSSAEMGEPAADEAADPARTARPRANAAPVDRAPAPRPRARHAEEPEAAPPTEPAAVPSPAGTVTHALPVPADDAKIAARLKALAGGEIDPRRVADVAARSRTARSQLLAAADNSDEAAARQVADEIAKERAFIADQARGGTMQMLRELSKNSVRMFDLVGDRAAFAARFARKETGPALDGPTWSAATGAVHGATLRFPAGSHAWHVRELDHAKEFPRDVVVEGAGMDATLIRLDELSARTEVTNLTFRDCTIDCGDNYFTDLRSDAPITLRLERCRVTGFDMGAGGSVMLAANTAAFYATDCRFEAGYGRTTPGYGNLFRVRSGLLVRCEGCVFRGPFSSVFDENAQATYVFSACRFERMPATFATVLATPPAGIRFEDCTATEPADPSVKLEKRPLSDFNAAWTSKGR